MYGQLDPFSPRAWVPTQLLLGLAGPRTQGGSSTREAGPGRAGMTHKGYPLVMGKLRFTGFNGIYPLVIYYSA